MEKYKKYIITIASILFIIITSIYFKKEIFNNDNSTNLSTDPSLVTTDVLENHKADTNTGLKLEYTEAKVTKVIDGDTIWVDIDGKSFKVRFIGINCPEYTKEIEPFGKEATEYTRENLEGKTIYLMKDLSDTDDYDRLLRYIWLKEVDEITEENISNYLFNAKLVQAGLAHSNYYKPNIALQDYIEKLEVQAKENKIGMWE